MCDICGIVSAPRPESSYWRKMCEYITNGGKFFQQNKCSMSAKCDCFEKEVSGTRSFAIFSGNLRNYDKLWQNMLFKGVILETQKSSELILSAYIVSGRGILKSLEGEFCGVIWDGYANELILFRDKVGFKRLFYYFDGQRLIFSSNIKSILKFPVVKKELCADIYCKLFTYYGNNNSEVFFKNVYEVKPACYVTYKDGKLKEKCYFTFDFTDSGDSFLQTINALEFLIKNENYPEIKENPISKHLLYQNICMFLNESCAPSPYITLCDLSNMGSSEKLLCNMNLFTVPKRFKLPVNNCEIKDRDYINNLLSQAPEFSYKCEKDIVKKEELYLKISIVIPEIVAQKKLLYRNIEFPYLSEQVLSYSIQSEKYKEKLLKNYFKTKSNKPLKENLKVLKMLFYDMIKSEDLMLGLVTKEEVLKFTRLMPRPETMLYLIQVDIWLKSFL